MNCPVDGTQLAISERQGIEIDYCPQCRGVWLDRGELDKLIERSADWAPAAPRVETRDRPREDKRTYDDGYSKKKKKKSLLGELFEFGD